MKSRNVNAVNNAENNLKSIISDTNSKTYNNTLKSPHSSNNLSEIQQREIFSCHKFQGSSIDISFNETNKNKEEYDNHLLYKQYLLSKTQYQKMISEIAEIDNKLIKNSNSIKKLETDLDELKKDKKQKKSDIINLLSNKESLEEIYKIKISSLINNSEIFENPKINGKLSKKENNMKNSQMNINIEDNNNSENTKDNEYNPFETINILNDIDCDNNNIEIKVDDIKISDQKKYEEQLSNFCEDILQKKDSDLINKLLQKLKIGYQVFFSEIKTPSIEPENIISNFFSRISVFISNKSKGKYPIPFIDSFLKQLLKINSINVKISEILSFLNKKYNEKQNEIKQKINFLNEKNENLKTKKMTYDNKRKELKAFIDENRDKFKNTGKNGIKVDKENTQCISFLLDNYFQDELDNMNENKIYELPEPIKINSSKNNNLENNENDIRGKNTKDMLSNRFLAKGFISEKKKSSMKNILNMTNYKINNNQKNEINDETDEGIIEKKESQIIGKLNSFIINKIPFNNENKIDIYENKEQNVDNNISSINVNNLIINNNLNIEKEKIINNKNDKKEEDPNNNTQKINNEKTKEDDNLNSCKYNNIHTEVKESHTNKIKRILIPRDFQFDYLQKIKSNKSNNHVSPKNLNRLKNKNVILLPLNNSQIFNKSKSPSRAKTIISQSEVPSPRTNNFNNVIQGIYESFCYFKLSDKNNNGFNPLNNVDVNPITLNYFEGSIKIEKIFNKLKISQKSANKYIGIELKDIVNISLNKQMENIVKIYNIYLKEGKNQKNFDVNNFILTKEIKEIRMQQNEKIKAINCKLFCFSILLEKKFIPKVEFIFNNYDDFDAWYKCFQSIVKLNSPDKEKK